MPQILGHFHHQIDAALVISHQPISHQHLRSLQTSFAPPVHQTSSIWLFYLMLEELSLMKTLDIEEVLSAFQIYNIVFRDALAFLYSLFLHNLL